MRERKWAVICVGLSLAGFGLAGYMAFLHLGLLRGELLGGAACGAAGSVFNCHAVTASAYGSLFGLPLAFWGIIGYLAAAALAVIAWRLAEWRGQALLTLVLLSGLFVLADAGLLAVMLTQIHYLCPLCLATYVVNLLLLVTAITAAGQRPGAALRRSVSAAGAFLRGSGALVFWGVLLVSIVLVPAMYFACVYMVQGPPGVMRLQMIDYVQRNPRVMVDTAGDSVLGNPNRPVRVVEFSDLLCPSCQKASKFNPIILAAHQQEISIVFKHFPLDMDCNDSVSRTLHPGACQVAAAAECAQEQGRFWHFHDRVFVASPKYRVAQLEQDAAATGLDLAAFQACMASGRGMEAVKRDVAEGKRLEVTSTPTYIINGVRVSGVLSPSVFGELLRAAR